ncbi:MAG: SPFH domain-containing protein [Aquabacterium sp.]|nr:MAG: SPFH domain-containing protein [Aquabacterium sp.]
MNDTLQLVRTGATTAERRFRSLSGYPVAAVIAAALLLAAAVVAQEAHPLLAAALLVACLAAAPGFYMLAPNEAKLMTLFGEYVGTDRAEGLRWANPLLRLSKVSLRARNLNTSPLKVNDKRGNPVEIGAAVVWKVNDTARALLEIDDYERFVEVQAEAAIRHLATQYAYDSGEDLDEQEVTLRAGLDAVANALRRELNQRYAGAGVEVLDAKLTHLAYAPEIAQVMLRRQQAVAIISARKHIVAGAVGMVEAALRDLSRLELVALDDERKAAMVSNLLVVLCSDKEVHPVINTGTLYT